MSCKELTLDSKGSCFLCLTRAPNPNSSRSDTDEGTGGTPEKFKLTVQSLGNICRLLKIDPYSILIKSIGNGGEEDNSKATISFGEFLVNSQEKNTKCEFSASLCDICYPVASKLDFLSHELEMIIMRTRDQLEKFHGILSMTPAASEQDPETSPKGNVEVETKLIENLREEMEHKSHSYLTREPMESPKTSHTNFDTGSHVTLTTIEEYRKRVRTPSSENSNEYLHVNQKNSHLSKKMRRNTPSPSLSTDKASPASTESMDTQGAQEDHEDSSVLDITHYKCLRIGDHCQCPFCGDLFSDSGSSEDGIDYHLVVSHLHKIYCSKNIANLSGPMFQQLCQQVVHQAIQLTSMPSDSNQTNNYIYSCLECNNNYKTQNWASFHFLMDHFKTFEDKLISAQHENQHLTFNQYQTVELQNSAPVQVNKVDDKQNFPVHHTAKPIYPSENLFHDLINIRSDDSSNNSQRSEYHQRQPTPATTPAPSESTPNECNGKMMGDKIQCSFCKAMFGSGKSSSSAIRLHVACFHPEKLFSASKLPEINEAIFHELCRDVIKGELRAAQASSQGEGSFTNILSCSNCKKTFTRMHNLKYHCVNSHFEFMANKLVQLQEDYLEEKSSAMQSEYKPSLSPLPHMSTPTSTSLEQQQHQWQTYMTEEQLKKTTTEIPATAGATTYTTESMQFPNFSFSSAGAMQTGSNSSVTPTNPTSTINTNDMIWSKSLMSATSVANQYSTTHPSPPPAHQMKTEGLYYQGSMQYPTTTSDSQQVYNTGWLPPPQLQVQSQSYYANPLPPPSSSQHQLVNQNYYDTALNQMNHGPAPTWLRLPYPADEQIYDRNQMEIVKQEKTSYNITSNSISSLPPIPQYLSNVGDDFIQSISNEDENKVRVEKTQD